MKLALLLLIAFVACGQTRLEPTGPVVGTETGETTTRPPVIKRPADEAGWRAIELPTKDTDLTARIDTYRPYCEWGEGLMLADGPMLLDEQKTAWVAHSHSTFATPEVWATDRDGNRTLVSGGDRIILIPAGLDAKLAARLCIPRVEDSTDREVMARLVKAAGAMWVRQIPEKWKPAEVVSPEVVRR